MNVSCIFYTFPAFLPNQHDRLLRCETQRGRTHQREPSCAMFVQAADEEHGCDPIMTSIEQTYDRRAHMAAKVIMRLETLDLGLPLADAHLHDQVMCPIKVDGVKSRGRINDRQCDPVLGGARQGRRRIRYPGHHSGLGRMYSCCGELRRLDPQTMSSVAIPDHDRCRSVKRCWSARLILGFHGDGRREKHIVRPPQEGAKLGDRARPCSGR